MMGLAFRSPVYSDGIEDLADWLELGALLAPNQNASLQDLVSELRRSGSSDAIADTADADRGSERSQGLADDAFTQLEVRQRACAGSYPFAVESQHIQTQSEAASSPYVFMLLLKTFGISAGPRNIKGASHFEELCTVAARNYLGGTDRGARSYHFGFPRRIAPSGFASALDALCIELGEGTGARIHPRIKDQKDAKLDLVAWRPFPDSRIGKYMAFGQCAAGDRYDHKYYELSPRSFTKTWMKSDVYVDPHVYFFVPSCVDEFELERISNAGTTILFDRCRTAALAGDLDDEPGLLDRTKKWIQAVIKKGKK